MSYHVMVTDLTGNSRLVACFDSPEAAVACRVEHDAAKDPTLCYWVQSTMSCTCNKR